MKKKKNSKAFNDRFKKKFITKKSVAVIIFTGIILCLVAFGSFRAYRQEQQLAAVARQYSQDNDQLHRQNEALEEEMDRIRAMNRAMRDGRSDSESEESIEDIARNTLGMIGDDEYSLQEEEKQE